MFCHLFCLQYVYLCLRVYDNTYITYLKMVPDAS